METLILCQILGEKLVKLDEFDIVKFIDAIWKLYLLEVLWRAKGNPVEADRLMNLRVQLKKSVGIESTFKEEENKPSE